MMKKLTVMLLVGIICLAGSIPVLAQGRWSTFKEYENATGNKIEKFSEAPMLRAKVATGELPPVEERLPEEPLIVEPVEEIGQYGGTIWQARTKRTFGSGLYPFVQNMLFNRSPDFTRVVPNIAKAQKVSADGKTTTIYLRKGMKWSDGHPFTADDLLFWYEDILVNDSLTPVKGWIYKRGGELGILRKIDDYTVEWSFAEPYGMFGELLGSAWGSGQSYAPKHYLKQFHPKYTSESELEKTMEEESFDTWIDLFQTKNDAYRNNPDLPGLGAFIVLDEEDAPLQRVVRNPYFWQIDTEGNQLPYIDMVKRPLVSDAESLVLKVIAGQCDFVKFGYLGTENYSFLMQNRDKGNYRFVPYVWMINNMGTIMFNFNHPDPYRRKLYGDKFFRIALSVAINREEISKLAYQGLMTPGQPRPPEGPPYHGESSLFQLYAEYNPELANQLLDEIGLSERDDQGYRLGLDGKELSIINYVGRKETGAIEAAEMIEKYWAEVGIRVTNKYQGGSLWKTQHRAGEHDISYLLSHVGGGSVPPVCNPNLFAFGNWRYAPKWALWLDTNGAEGVEPPLEVKQLRELQGKILAETSTQQRVKLTWEAFENHARNLWAIGVVNYSWELGQFVVSNRLRNVPLTMGPHGRTGFAGTWFLKE